MPEHIQYEDDDLFNPETHHESSDVPVRPLWWALVIFIVFAVVTHVVLWFFYKGMVKAERSRMDPPATGVTRPADADVPKNQPLLQPFPRSDGQGSVVPPQANTPVTDLVAMRAAEDKVLKNYGWIDRHNGVVHIPIDLAKELLAARLALEGQVGAASAATAAPADSTAAAPAAPPAPANVPPGAGSDRTTTGGTQ